MKNHYQKIDLDVMRPPNFLKNIKKRNDYILRKIKQKNGFARVRRCPICKSKSYSECFVSYQIPMLRCLDCKVVFSGMIAKELKDIYGGKDYLGIAKKAYLTQVNYRVERFATERINLLKSTGKIKGKKLIDIGCGTGWFLKAAISKGIVCEGLEYSPYLANHTSKNLGISIYKDLKEIPKNSKYDFITMFDLIEHLEYPVDYIRYLKEHLVPDGKILIFTPNFDSFAISYAKENSNLITPFEHLIYFNKQSMVRLAKLLNMKVDWFETKGLDMGDLSSYFEWAEQNKMAKLFRDTADIIQPILDSIGFSNHMRFMLSKR
jgi:2-polyprenyl-3-methyl-5-hydroxy-6-metoxy-1,4-benzoquinol methylase